MYIKDHGDNCRQNLEKYIQMINFIGALNMTDGRNLIGPSCMMFYSIFTKT
jgi:hypothetical protein